MSNPGTPDVLSGYRAQARLLLKQFRSDRTGDVRAAAERFRRLRSFAALSVDDLLRGGGRVRLKHALAVVALDNGHASWIALKTMIEKSEGAEQEPAMYVASMGFLLNRWFVRYPEARASLESDGGYLLPHRDQFFITEVAGIDELGLEPDDPDWERIGWDWVRPQDHEAHGRLTEKRRCAAASVSA